jgi:diguanylate cyclase (GGDEF)-like protein
MLLAAGSAWAERLVRVGVYRNLPMVNVTPQGEVAGLQIELLQKIALDEGWTLRYIPGTFEECFGRLQRYDIDMMPAIAYTPQRAELVDFGDETVVVNWGVVVVPQGSSIQSILDLDGKRVAAVRKSVYYEGPTGLKALSAQFGISPVFTEVAEYPDVLQRVADRQVDAGIVHRFSIAAAEQHYDIRPSPLVVSPVEVRYAYTRGKEVQLRQAVDRHLRAMKEDNRSIYHRAIGKWVGDGPSPGLPGWLKPAAVTGGIVILLLLLAWLAASLQILRNRTDLREKDERLSFVANHDALTGLPNQGLLREMLDHAIAASQSCGSRLSLLLLDLDRFKNLNDTLGHATGDEVLRQVAERIRSQVRAADTLGRYGGDEFIIILEQLDDAAAAAIVAQKILDAIAAPLTIDDREFYFTASIGISICPDDRSGREELVTCAEIAMYDVKEAGGNAYRFYRSEMDSRAHHLLLLEADLRRAIERNQLVMHYQPLYDMNDGRMTGMEALVRWHHPVQGLVPPLDFIPLAERTGLIITLGEWILREICRQLGEWQQRGLTPPRVAVNISALQFRHPDFLASVDYILESTGTSPQLLEFEITETVTMGDFEAVLTTLTAIRQRGITLSIDDFGTGYSSLTYLKRFPINKLKIDRTFVREITSDQNDAAIASAIILLARSMELGVVAEGIETEEQCTLLMEKGCTLGQGYYFSYPVPGEELEKLLSP